MPVQQGGGGGGSRRGRGRALLGKTLRDAEIAGMDFVHNLLKVVLATAAPAPAPAASPAPAPLLFTDIEGPLGSTALQLAVELSEHSAITLLLEAGANPRKGTRGRSPKRAYGNQCSDAPQYSDESY